MSLRYKTILFIGITLICLLIVIFTISSNIFLDGFARLERQNAIRDGQEILNVINDDLSALSSALGDWAAWDDTYNFIKDVNQLYIKKNLPDETYSELKINLILFINSSGEIIFGRAFDLLNKKELPLPKGLKEHISINSFLIRHNSTDSSIEGIIFLPEGHMLIASRPILTSERKGPIRGSMIFGRFISEAEAKRWSEISQLSLKIYPIKNGQIPSDLSSKGFDLERDTIFIETVDSKTILGYVRIKDIYGKPSLVIRFDIERSIYEQGKLTFKRFVILLIISGLIFGVVIVFFIEKSILSRLMHISSDLKVITASSDHSLRVDVKGRDELSNIASDINDMLSSLEEAHSIFSAVIDNLPEGVILLNSQYRVVLANKIGLEHLNVLSNAGIGDVISHIGDQSVNELSTYFARPSHIVRQSINFANRFFEITGKYIGKNKDVSLIFVIADVTKEKAELLGKIQSQENLSAVGQLAAGIAHDFNNILTGIMGYSELLSSDLTVPEKVRRQLKIIFHNAERASALVKQILDFSRKSLSEFEVVDLLLFLKEFIVFLKRIIPENIHIKLEYGKGKYNVMGDRTKLQQVLMNLSLNAVDAMPQGGELLFGLSKIDVTNKGMRLSYSEAIIPQGEWIVLKVKDSGTGIPKDVLPRIFEPFFTTKEVGKGTGLGLSQAYGIVKQHNGYIDVQSDENFGTTFIIYLPITYENEKIVPKNAEAMSKGIGQTILVVEDDSDVLDFINTALTYLGYNVIASNSVTDALKIFERDNKDINLIITDMVMPEMDGLKLIEKLRQINPFVKMIIMSGYPLGLEHEIRALKIEACLLKPIKMSELAHAVSNALNQ